MADEDTPDVEGADDAALVDEAPVDAPVDETPEVEPETYTREQLAELLPHFDRFAQDHDGVEAFKQYGSAYDNARRLISTGGHMTTQEEQAYRAAGIDPSEVQVPQYEEPAAESMPIFGAPWEPPASWDEYVAYAQSDSPDQRRVAAYGVMQSDADQQTKQWFFNQWAQADPYGAASYNQQVLIERQEEMRQTLKDEILAEMSPLKQAHNDTYAKGVISRAVAEIPGLRENYEVVNQLMDERRARYPGYEKLWEGNDPQAQLAELQELTLIAANRASGARKQAQAKATQGTEDAMLAARTETSRTNGAPETEADAERRRDREQMRRVGARVF